MRRKLKTRLVEYKARKQIEIHLLKQKQGENPSRFSRMRLAAKSFVAFKPGRSVLVIVALTVLLAQPIASLFLSRDTKVSALSTGTASNQQPDGDNAAGWALCNNAACGGTQHYTLVNDSSDSTYVNTGTNNTSGGEVDDYTIQDPTISGTFVATTKVDVVWRANTPTCQSTCDDVQVNIYIAGSLQTLQTSTMTTTITDRTTTFTGNWGAINDLRVTFTRVVQGNGTPSGRDDDVRIYKAYTNITYTYIKTPPLLAQKGYIWEMDDASGDGSAQLAAGNTAVTMRAGERATLRAQLRNTGGPVDTENLGLFYDRSDGLWSKVRAFQTRNISAGSGCNDSSWTCTLADSTDSVGTYASMAMSKTGTPWISYYDTTNANLEVAKYVGSGGNCDSSAWQCETVDSTGDVGKSSSITIDPTGVAWVSYIDVTNVNVKVAKYVGSGGSGCASSSWTCTAVDTVTDTTIVYETSIVSGITGDVWAAYYESTTTTCGASDCDFHIAKYDGDATSSGCTDAAWTCTVLDNLANAGTESSLAVTSNNIPWVSYLRAGDLYAAYYDGDGTSSGCTDAAWTCTAVDVTDTVGSYNSIAISPSGNPWISYYDSTGANLEVAYYVGGASGNCNSVGAGSSDWQCTSVATTTTSGLETSIAFDPSGMPLVSYYRDDTLNYLETAAYLGGATTGTGCAVNTWECTTVEEVAGSTFSSSSVAFDPIGHAWIAYYNNGDLGVANVADRSGEILISPSYGGSATLSESHADMTTTTDTTNRDDADCLTSGTWNNGKYFIGEEGSVSIADGQSTAQCTEIAFTIDTTQAVPGTTYRFVIATNDSSNQDKGKWRGPASIDYYPTLTVENDAVYSTTQTVSKDSLYTLPNCTDTSWGCAALDDPTSNSVGQHNNLSFGPDGTAYATYVNDTNPTQTKVVVAKYVGSGGSGCGSGSSAWTCTNVYDNASLTYSTSIAVSPDGTPYVAFRNDNTVVVGKYVGGSSGTGCGSSGSTAWTCTIIKGSMAANNLSKVSIAFAPNGAPHISYHDATSGVLSLEYAYYNGSGLSTSCTSSNWTCYTLDYDVGTNTFGLYSSIAISSSGTVYVSYSKATAGNYSVHVAQYVGSGGSGCNSGSTAWVCTDVDHDATWSTGTNNSIAISPSGVPYISYYNSTSASLSVAYYDGDGTSSGCGASGSVAWTCTTVDDDATYTAGNYTSIAFDSSGVPYVSYYGVSTTSLKLARYVGGSSGTGCGSAGSSAWTCTTIDNTGTDTGTYTSLAFDRNGMPMITYQDATNTTVRVAVYKGSLGAPTYDISNNRSGRNVRTTYGRYALSNGKPSASTSDSCTATTDLLGICGIETEDTRYDSITAQAYHRPMFQMRARFDNNAIPPQITWAGQSTIAASTQNILIQVYRYGTTNAWETVTTNTSCSASTACVLYGEPIGTASEYFSADGSNYWVYIRVVQAESTSGATTLKTDAFRAVQPQQWLRHGQTFNRNAIQPFDTTAR